MSGLGLAECVTVQDVKVTDYDAERVLRAIKTLNDRVFSLTPVDSYVYESEKFALRVARMRLNGSFRDGTKRVGCICYTEADYYGSCLAVCEVELDTTFDSEYFMLRPRYDRTTREIVLDISQQSLIHDCYSCSMNWPDTLDLMMKTITLPPSA